MLSGVRWHCSCVCILVGVFVVACVKQKETNQLLESTNSPPVFLLGCSSITSTVNTDSCTQAENTPTTDMHDCQWYAVSIPLFPSEAGQIRLYKNADLTFAILKPPFLELFQSSKQYVVHVSYEIKKSTEILSCKRQRPLNHEHVLVWPFILLKTSLMTEKVSQSCYVSVLSPDCVYVFLCVCL